MLTPLPDLLLAQHVYTATDIVLIIGALGTLITSAIAAWKASTSNRLSSEQMHKTDSQHDVNQGKLNRIEASTNGVILELKTKVDAQTVLIDELRLQNAKLESRLGERRSSDSSVPQRSPVTDIRIIDERKPDR